MRVWLDADQMKARSLTPVDVINAIQQQSQEVAAGQIGAPPAPDGQAFQFTLDLRGRFNEAAQFENIAVKATTGSGGAHHPHPRRRPRRARRADLQPVHDHGHQPAAGIAIFQLPEANALAGRRGGEAGDDAACGELSRRASRYTVPFDTTPVRAAPRSDEVYMTLFEAAVLVLIVILVFLQNWRATLVPATTVPVTIIGAFAAMAVLGFSVNLLTLFALVLAIGIVVDDAIVVVEGARQNIERGEEPKRRRSMRWTSCCGRSSRITLVLLSRVPAGLDPARDRRPALSPVRARHRGDRGDQRDQRRQR